MFCQIRVRGHLPPAWAEWFDGLEITNEPGGEALLTGSLPDQAAFFAVLNRFQTLNLPLVWLTCIATSSQDSPSGQ